MFLIGFYRAGVLTRRKLWNSYFYYNDCFPSHTINKMSSDDQKAIFNKMKCRAFPENPLLKEAWLAPGDLNYICPSSTSVYRASDLASTNDIRSMHNNGWGFYTNQQPEQISLSQIDQKNIDREDEPKASTSGFGHKSVCLEKIYTPGSSRIVLSPHNQNPIKKTMGPHYTPCHNSDQLKNKKIFAFRRSNSLEKGGECFWLYLQSEMKYFDRGSRMNRNPRTLSLKKELDHGNVKSK